MTQELIKQPIQNLPEGMTQEDIFIHLFKDEQEAFDYWKLWEPSHNTKMEIKQLNGQTSLELVG